VPKSEDAPFTKSQLAGLKSFRSLKPMQRAALAVITTMLGDRDVRASRELFVSLDKDGDGLLSLEELQRRLSRCRSVAMQPAAVEQLFRDPSCKDGDLKPFTFTEFMAATVARKHCGEVGVCQAAFRLLDKNGDGQISCSDLATSKLLGHLPPEELKKILQEVQPGGRSVCPEAFERMLRKLAR